MHQYGLIGYPLTHSFSKKFFTEKFEREALADVSFHLFPLESIHDFPELISLHPNLSGLAVTIPYKQSVMEYLHELSPEAAEMGAVNCIKISSGRRKGYNTDAFGFEQTFLPMLQPHHQRALVLGDGGASKAVQYVLQKNRIPFTVVSRHPAKDNLLYSDIDHSILQSHPIIINCTPLGMHPEEAGCPDLPYHAVGKQHLLYDLIYNPSQTEFLKRGARQGAATRNGYPMLVCQAEKNWQIWNED